MNGTRRVSPSGRAASAATFLSLLAVGCAGLPPTDVPAPSRSQGVLITPAQIEESGARDAWEAIRRNVNHLRFQESMDGDPVWVGAVRGNQSMVADDAVLLVVDGTPVGEASYLQDIPARTVAYIQILSGVEGTARYGMAGGNGVVYVRTHSPKRGIAQGNVARGG